MNLREYLPIDNTQLRRFDDIYARYRKLYEDPDHCLPMIIIHAPGTHKSPSMEEQLNDPLLMLKAHLDGLRTHLEIGDDCVPVVSVNFGTAQVAHAFGCELYVPPNNTPAASSHVLSNIEDVRKVRKPSVTAGWFGKLEEWTGIWKENLPPGVHIQHFDVQSTFNSAHLIRGNDILLDFYDHPEELDHLLAVVTDYMIDVTRHYKALVSDDREWFFDWGAMWKGTIRISNCSMHMISPEFYQKHILRHDTRFLKEVGGGRIHYCGSAPEVIDDFLTIPDLTGLDVEFWRHDFYPLVKKIPKRVSLIPTGNIWRQSDMMKQLLAGNWPDKRNIIIQAGADSVDDGKRMLEKLRAAMPWK